MSVRESGGGGGGGGGEAYALPMAPLELRAAPGEREFAFHVEWHDRVSDLLREFNLVYYECDGTVEMFDRKAKKTFLRRCAPPERVSVDAFVAGNTVTVLARPLRVVGYLNAAARARFSSAVTKSCVLVKPDGIPHLGSLVQIAFDAGFDVTQMRMLRLSRKEAEAFLAVGAGAGGRGAGVDSGAEAEFLAADAVVALEVAKEDGVAAWQEVMGPRDPAVAREVAPGSIRARFGTDAVRNCVFGSRTAAEAEKECAFLFAGKRASPACFDNCAALIVRPHAVAAKHTALVIEEVLQSGLEISALRSVAMQREDIEDLLQCYKGVVPEFPRWVVEMSEGPCVVMEVRGEEVVPRLRDLCGPYDPEIARALRPRSLRARLGIDSVRNALHCTDLPKDGPLESKFLFRVVE